MAMMDWIDSKVGEMVEQTFMRGNHNSLCLAHGREPIIPVSIDVDVNTRMGFFFRSEISESNLPKQIVFLFK